MGYIHIIKKYTVFLTTEEIIECDNLKVLYDAVRRRIRMNDEKFTAFFYKNIDWWNGGFDGQTPFFQMGTEKSVPNFFWNFLFRRVAFLEFYLDVSRPNKTKFVVDFSDVCDIIK